MIEHYREEDFLDVHTNPGVSSLSWLGANEWQLGHPDQALRYLDDSRSLARRQKNPFAMAYAGVVGSYLHAQRGDFGRALAAVTKLCESARRQVSPCGTRLPKSSKRSVSTAE